MQEFYQRILLGEDYKIECILIKVHPSLLEAFKKIGEIFAEDIKKRYNLTEIYVPNTLASQILAGEYIGKMKFNFQINKTGLNKGTLKIVN